MENKQQISKGEQWFFHPFEKVRMLRYFQLNMRFNESLQDDFTPSYSENPSVGVVIGTYGSVPFIDLQLHFLVNVNGITNVLVCDDCSTEQTELKILCDSYGVDFYSSPTKLFNKDFIGILGDNNAFFEGLKWAKSKNIELLVKLSRRLIPCFNWKKSLIDLALKTDASTFCSFCTKEQFNFRTECVGMNVDIWTKNYPLHCLAFTIENEMTVFAEFWFHELAKTLSGNNFSEKWLKYVRDNKHGYLKSGYAHWYDILGTCKLTNDGRPDVFWHAYNTIEDYYNLSKKIFGNKYTLEDFNKNMPEQFK